MSQSAPRTVYGRVLGTVYVQTDGRRDADGGRGGDADGLTDAGHGRVSHTTRHGALLSEKHKQSPTRDDTHRTIFRHATTGAGQRTGHTTGPTVDEAVHATRKVQSTVNKADDDTTHDRAYTEGERTSPLARQIRRCGWLMATGGACGVVGEERRCGHGARRRRRNHS